MRPDARCALQWVADVLFPSMAQPFLAAVAETCASFSFCAHSSQHTSTVLPPILILIGFTSSLQSQAAQVLSTMTLLSLNTRSPGLASRPRRRRASLSEYLAICLNRL